MLRPTLDVELSRAGLTWRMKALVDTGSPVCVFPRGAGEALGLHFASDALSPAPRLVDMLGERWAAVPEVVDLTLPRFPTFNWEAEVLFLVKEWDMPYGVLGQDGFLHRWAASFNYYGGYFVIEPADQFAERLPVDEFEEIMKRFPDPYQPPGMG